MSRRGLARFTGPAPDPEAAGAAAPDGGTTAPALAPDDLELPPVLARFVGTRPRPTPGEACEMCAAPVADDHRHVVDLERRSLLCTCRGCALLFERTGDGDQAPGHRPADARPHDQIPAHRLADARPRDQIPAHRLADARPRPGARYRTVPDRYLAVAPFTLPGHAWATLQIPVGIAFVVANTQLERTVAFYPSPGGATESELPLDAWADVVAANPALADVAADVEAVLLRTGEGDPTCHVVPVDRCYELVGAMRLHWRGFDGGAEVREHIAAFFDDVTSRSRRGGSAPDRSPAHLGGDGR